MLGIGGKQEVGAGKEGDVEKDNERVADGDAEAREEVLEHTRGLHARRHGIGRGVFAAEARGGVGAPEIDGVEGDEEGAGELQGGLVLLEPIDHQAQKEYRDDGVEEVGERGTQAGEEPWQSSLVEGALYDQDARRAHGCRNQDSDGEAPDDG